MVNLSKYNQRDDYIQIKILYTQIKNLYFAVITISNNETDTSVTTY